MSLAQAPGRRRRPLGLDLVTSLGTGHPAAVRAALVALSLIVLACVSSWLSSGLKASYQSYPAGGGEAVFLPDDGCAGPIAVPKVALLFLVRHEALHNTLWTAWLDSVNGLLPAAAVQEACCGRGRGRGRQRQRQRSRGRSVRELDVSDEPQAAIATSNISQPVTGRVGGPISGSKQVLYSVYVHDSANSRADYVPGDFFFGHRLPTRIVTRWGSSTLTVAFKLLLKTALLEPSNQRFVLLDESAVPLYPAAAVYLQLMGETKSRVAACAEPPPSHPERWAANMTKGNFTGAYFRESSQWKMLTRAHAQVIDDDTIVLDRFLYRCPLKSRELCITDEHYDATVLAFYGVGDETTCNPNGLVEVNWRQFEWEKGSGAHPHMYTAAESHARTLAMLRTLGFDCQPHLTVRGAEQLGNFVQADKLAGLRCHEPPYTPPFGQGWSSRARGNVHCHLFSRKWPAATADNLLHAALQMRIVTAPVDLPKDDNSSLVQCS